MSEVLPALRFPYTAAEYGAIASALAARQGFSLLRYALWALVGAMPVALLLIVLQGGVNLRPERLVPLSLGGGVLFVLIYGALENRILGFWLRRRFAPNQTMTVAFDETGIRWSVAGISAAAAWDRVAFWHLTPEHLAVVFRDTDVGVAVPRRACSNPEAFQSLLAFVKERVRA